MLVNTIDGECHKVLSRAVSIKNMKSGDVVYRHLVYPKRWGERRSWSGEQISPLQRLQAALCRAVIFVCIPSLYGKESYTYEYCYPCRP